MKDKMAFSESLAHTRSSLWAAAVSVEFEWDELESDEEKLAKKCNFLSE